MVKLIVHHVPGHFSAETPHGVAETSYIPTQTARVFVHTAVPPEDQGHGFASRLIAEAVADTVRAGLHVVAVCPFVAAYLEKHPEALQVAHHPKAVRHARAE